MISLQQMRAARGLLNWNQSDLARHCGLSVTAMNNIDRGLSAPRLTTMDTIQKLFEAHGVEFTAGHGVRLRDDVFRVQSYEGDDAIVLYFAEVVDTLRRHGGQARHILGNEEPFISSPENWKAFSHYYKSFRRYGLSEKVLLAENTPYRYGPPDCATYRTVSNELASQIGSSVYGNKYTIFLEDRIVTIENPAIADAYRAQFEHNWKRGKAPPPYKPLFEEDMERRSDAKK